MSEMQYSRMGKPILLLQILLYIYIHMLCLYYLVEGIQPTIIWESDQHWEYMQVIMCVCAFLTFCPTQSREKQHSYVYYIYICMCVYGGCIPLISTLSMSCDIVPSSNLTCSSGHPRVHEVNDILLQFWAPFKGFMPNFRHVHPFFHPYAFL